MAIHAPRVPDRTVAVVPAGIRRESPRHQAEGARPKPASEKKASSTLISPKGSQWVRPSARSSPPIVVCQSAMQGRADGADGTAANEEPQVEIDLAQIQEDRNREGEQRRGLQLVPVEVRVRQ